MSEMNQNATNIYNSKTLFILYSNGHIEKIDTQQEWDEGLGKSNGRFSYKNELITLVGRDEEKQWLHNFLESDKRFIISAITGRAGNGKSSLVYSFCKNELNKDEWYVVSMPYTAISDLLIKAIKNKSKVLLVIDYVLAYAKEIGQWLRGLEKTVSNHSKVRVLLIERAHVIEDRFPQWYNALVKDNDLEKNCDYKFFLKISDLKEGDLKKIFLKYIEKYGKKQDVIESKLVADQILRKIDYACKTPLFILFIAQAWLDDKNRNIRRWDRESLLTYIEKKEERRIEKLFGEEYVDCIDHLKRILVFAMMLSGIDIGEKLPNFLKDDLKEIREALKKKNKKRSPITNLFLDMGEYDKAKVCFRSALPEIVEEYYCLKYLKDLDDDLQGDVITEIISCAWKENSRAFAGFLCRVIEDFSDHKMVSFEYILQLPDDETVNSVLYADVIREYTYWNHDVELYLEDVMAIFEKLLQMARDEEAKEIREKYAIALFNLQWNIFTYANKEDEKMRYSVLIEEKLKKLVQEDSSIQEIYDYSQTVFDNQKIFIG